MAEGPVIEYKDLEGRDRRLLRDLYTSMLRIRLFEEKIVELYPEQEMKCPVHLCIGQEAVAVGVAAVLKREDYLFSNHRGHGHCLAKGMDMKALMAELYLRTTGCSRGKGGSMHLVDTSVSIPGTSAIVGGGIPMAVGAALASAMRGDGRIAVVFFGDGAFDEGVYHESMNFAALRRLPVVFVCENNFYATNSPQDARQPLCRIAESASSYGVPGVCIDGNNVLEVLDASLDAAERARSGKGPTLIEAKTYRWKGHVGPEVDHEKGARPMDELFHWMKRCPVRNFEEALLKAGILDDGQTAAMRENIRKEIDEAVEFSKRSPRPEASDLLTQVYAEG